MWSCKNCLYKNNDDSLEDCKLCKAPKGFDPDGETKIMPAILMENQPRVGTDKDKK